MPNSVLRDAITAEKLFPEKRKIIHFMQPHTPFIESEVDKSSNSIPEGVSEVDPENIATRESKLNNEKLSELDLAEEGRISEELVIKHYRQNLEILEKPLNELGDSLEGKTVVTSDHGEVLNGNGLYGHWRGSKLSSLRKVPWDVL